MKAKIVIDLTFGDGGKGSAIDSLYLSNPNSIAVRFAGGHQCGHTVYTSLSKFHEHQSFAAVGLRGGETYVSEHCIMYPTKLLWEMDILAQKGATPNITYNPLTMVATPFDIAWNQAWEEFRGGEAHGSCGQGIGATMDRNNTSGYKLCVLDLKSKNIWTQKLAAIGIYYTNKVSQAPANVKGLYSLKVTKLLEEFMYSVDEMFKFNQVRIANYDYLQRFDTLLFEGNQGVMLDQDHGIFPNVTYSKTTSVNALEVIDKITSLCAIEIVYVTRCYTSRHGNGWMPGEEIELINTQYEVNKTNQYQGKFRVTELDYDLLNHAIEVDNIYSYWVKHKSLIVCCMDQRPDFEFDEHRISGLITNGIHYRDTPVTQEFKL